MRNCECIATWGFRRHVSRSALFLARCSAHAHKLLISSLRSTFWHTTRFIQLPRFPKIEQLFGDCTTFLRCDIEFWHLTFNVWSTSGVTWSSSVPNLNKIEQSAADLLKIEQISLAATVTFDSLTLNFCSTLIITCRISVQHLREIAQSAAELRRFVLWRFKICGRTRTPPWILR